MAVWHLALRREVLHVGLHTSALLSQVLVHKLKPLQGGLQIHYVRIIAMALIRDLRHT